MKTGQGVVNTYTMRNLLIHNKLLKIGGSAQKPKVTINDELLSFVNSAEPFVQESNVKETNAWITNNMGAIREFLKSKNKYRLIEDIKDLQDRLDQEEFETDGEEE